MNVRTVSTARQSAKNEDEDEKIIFLLPLLFVLYRPNSTINMSRRGLMDGGWRVDWRWMGMDGDVGSLLVPSTSWSLGIAPNTRYGTALSHARPVHPSCLRCTVTRGTQASPGIPDIHTNRYENNLHRVIRQRRHARTQRLRVRG